MNRRVVMEVSVGALLLYRFRLAAWRSNQNPSLLLRKMMQKFIATEADPKTIDLSVVSNSRRPDLELRKPGGSDWP